MDRIAVTIYGSKAGLRRKREICDTTFMTRMSEIPTELLNKMTSAAQALVQTLCAWIQKQGRIIAAQQKRSEELERRLDMNSGNSSMPTSRDRPAGQPPVKPSKEKSGKKRGGQHSQPKRVRSLGTFVSA